MNIANDVVACIREQLFDLILRDTLLVQTYEERIITASLHVSELAAAVTGSVLAHPLIEALFDHVCFEGVASGSAAAPAIGPPPACTCWQHAVDLDSEAMISESQANSPEASALDFAFMSPLALAQTVFTRRLRSRNPQVAAATVRLVDQLLGMFSFCVLERLILAPPCPAARFGQCQGRANSGQRGPSNDSLAPSASVDNCPASPSSPFHLAAPDTSSNLEETLVMAGPSLQSQLWIRVVLSIFPDLLSQQTFLTEVAQHHGSLPADEHGQISHPATFSRAPGQEVPYDDYFLGVFDLEQRVRHLWADSPWVVNPLPSRLQISGVSTASGEAAPTTPVAADAPSTPSRAGPPAPLTIGLSPSGQVAATPAVSREAAEQAARLRPVGPLLPALLSLLNRAPDHSPAMLLSLTSCISRMALYPWPSVQRSIFALTGDLATALGALQEQVRASQAADPAQRLSPTQLELMLDEIAIPSSGFGLSGTGRPDEPRTLLSTLQTLGKLLSALGEQVPSLHRRPDQENENSPSAQLIISFLKLCNALARKLSRHPVLTSVLIIRTSSLGINREPSLGTLQGSPIAPTSPFRRVANGVPLVESMIVDDVANSALGLCCQVVVEHINSTGKRGQLARESLLSLISLTSVPDIHHFFRNDLMLPMRLAEVGVLLFCRLPSRLEPSPSGSPSLAAANRAGAPASDSSPQAATGSPGLGPSLPGASSSVDFMLDLASSPLRAFISYIRYLIALLESPEVSGPESPPPRGLISQGLLEDHTHAQYHICLVMVILSEFCKEIAATYLLLSSVHFNNHQ
ncbi:hypothetical protein H696_00878 [Fonticula alba]|uniref:FHF complex subunit HOOK-interacting protein C-terminal domain-containing protein n=1 Tax=Fonticula alba TaxID=691883 RepID=A0A058ZG51_FONAL|nr:hypothetical protein H696_00878 [Fonticula alba]KCV73339.1 hypothetical protein H696_00878 [Fonticula alba]|eukprot:XP_009493040.1 hypothetical protein H696_00878 [Fonticula alba]